MAITISGSGTMGVMASGGITGGATLTSGTAVASTSGTSIDFTSIPSWVKRITVLFNNVGTASINYLQVQLGSGSIQTSGYSGSVSTLATGISITATPSSAFYVVNKSATGDTYSGAIVFTLQSSNNWVMTSAIYGTNLLRNNVAGGSISLSGALSTLSITDSSGASFNAGSINVLYE